MQGAAVFAVLGQGVLGGDHHEVPGAQFPLQVGPAPVAQVLGGADHGGVVDVGALGDFGDVRVGGELRIAGDDLHHPALGLGQRDVRNRVAEPRLGAVAGAPSAPAAWLQRPTALVFKAGPRSVTQITLQG